MSTTYGKLKLSISLDPAVVAKLPKKNRSHAIEAILKQYFQYEASDRLYEAIKQKLMRDKDMSEWIEFTVRETR